MRLSNSLFVSSLNILFCMTNIFLPCLVWVPKYYLIDLFYNVSNLYIICGTIAALGGKRKNVVNQREAVCPSLLISPIHLACSLHLAEKENRWCEAGTIRAGSDVHKVDSSLHLQLPGGDFSKSLWMWVLQCVCPLELVAAIMFSLECITKYCLAAKFNENHILLISCHYYWILFSLRL